MFISNLGFVSGQSEIESLNGVLPKYVKEKYSREPDLNQ